MSLLTGSPPESESESGSECESESKGESESEGKGGSEAESESGHLCAPAALLCWLARTQSHSVGLPPDSNIKAKNT